MSLYQQCRLSFSDCLLNGDSHFEEVGWDRDYFVAHSVSIVGRCSMSHMQSYISQLPCTLCTHRYVCIHNYAYIIRKRDCCTCVLFDPFNHTVTDKPSKEACIGRKLQVLIVDGLTPAAHSSHVQEIVPFLKLVCHTVGSSCVNSTKNF